MGKVKTQPPAFDERACLIDMVSERISQSLMQQMGRGMVLHDKVPFITVHFKVVTLVFPDYPSVKSGDMNILTVRRLVDFGYFKRSAVVGNGAFICNLPAADCIERCLIKNELDGAGCPGLADCFIFIDNMKQFCIS